MEGRGPPSPSNIQEKSGKSKKVNAVNAFVKRVVGVLE